MALRFIRVLLFFYEDHVKNTLFKDKCDRKVKRNYLYYVSVSVTCSTVTVGKCQAALRHLQNFDYFKPTCLCREPHVDPECNSFRDFLFDHPCVTSKKGKYKSNIFAISEFLKV